MFTAQNNVFGNDAPNVRACKRRGIFLFVRLIDIVGTKYMVGGSNVSYVAFVNVPHRALMASAC